MYDVFISYSRKDTKIVDRICKELDKNNISYFIDRQGISGGMEFPEIIVDAIDNSRIFLFIGSCNSYESRYALNEVTYTYNAKGKNCILPYIIDNTPLPRTLQFVFGSVNYRNISEHPINSVLIEDIKAMLGQIEPETGNVTPTAPEPLNKKTEKTGILHYFKDKNIAFYIAVVTQIAVIAAILVRCLYLFQAGYVSNTSTNNNTLERWSNMILMTSLLCTATSTAILIFNKKLAFYTIAASDILTSVCTWILSISIYAKSFQLKSKAYKMFNTLGDYFANSPYISLFSIIALISIHILLMWAIMQIKKNKISAWDLLK